MQRPAKRMYVTVRLSAVGQPFADESFMLTVPGRKTPDPVDSPLFLGHSHCRGPEQHFVYYPAFTFTPRDPRYDPYFAIAKSPGARRLSGPQTSSDSSRAKIPASITMTPATWANIAVTANRKIAPATTRVMPTPVLTTDRPSTGRTRLGRFTGAPPGGGP
jgi:hypothetical protein